MTSSTLDSTAAAGTSGAATNFLFRLICRVGTVGTGLIAIVAGLLYAKQESLLYFPEINGIPRRPRSNPRQYRSPSEYGLPFTSHKIKCSDNIFIHAWLLLQKQNSNSSPTVIFFHGNAGNIGLRLPNAAQMYHSLGCNVFMVEYRGYGDSDDVKPNEKGLKLDAEAAYRFLLADGSNGNDGDNNDGNNDAINIDTNKIFVFGRSLGGAVAFHLAKYAEHNLQKPLMGIIVENTFTSISKMVDQLMPAIAPLKFLVLRMDWNSEKIAPKLKTPILYLAGEKDELVPHSQMTDLYQKSKVGVCLYSKIHIIKGGTHNESWVQGGREYFFSIKSFMSHVILHGQGLWSQSHNKSIGGASSISTSSFDDLDRKTVTRSTASASTSTSTSSVEVTMGGESVADTSSSNNIPLMPKNILSMAKEATKSFSAGTNVSDKKKEI